MGALLTGEPTDERSLGNALKLFRQHARILENQLARHPFVTGDRATIADFSMACHAGFIELGGVPIADYPHIARWYRRMDDIQGWKAAAPVLD